MEQLDLVYCEGWDPAARVDGQDHGVLQHPAALRPVLLDFLC